jgi:hypothetical protein
MTIAQTFQTVRKLTKQNLNNAIFDLLQALLFADLASSALPLTERGSGSQKPTSIQSYRPLPNDFDSKGAVY